MMPALVNVANDSVGRDSSLVLVTGKLGNSAWVVCEWPSYHSATAWSHWNWSLCIYGATDWRPTTHVLGVLGAGCVESVRWSV